MSQIKTNGLFCDTECPFFRDDHEGTASCFSDNKWKALAYSWSAKETPRHKSCVLSELAEKDREIERLSKRDGNASIELCYDDGFNPFARSDCKHLDFGVADNCYVIESELLNETLRENKTLRDMCEKMAGTLEKLRVEFLHGPVPQPNHICGTPNAQCDCLCQNYATQCDILHEAELVCKTYAAYALPYRAAKPKPRKIQPTHAAIMLTSLIEKGCPITISDRVIAVIDGEQLYVFGYKMSVFIVNITEMESSTMPV
ncbi:MAG TPA: hypothetical protein PLK08_05575 [Phycisphaerae bacterium]|nr:hypothetical protein [Phycisphaerae bacterium]